MESPDFPNARQDRISIARCRELLGDESDALSDQDIGRLRYHADAMARELVEIFLENHTTPE